MSKSKTKEMGSRIINKKFSDIQKLIEVWAKAQAQQAETTFEWIDLDSKKKETTKSSQFKENQKLKIDIPEPSKSIEYVGKRRELTDKQIIIKKQIYDLTNSSNKKTHVTTEVASTVTRTSSHTFKYAAKLGVSLTVGIPKVLSSAFSGEFSVENSKAGTRGRSDTEKMTVSIDVDAHSKEEVEYTLYEIPVEQKFTCKVELKGVVPVLFKDKVRYEKGHVKKSSDGKKLIFVPVVSIFKALKSQGTLSKTYSIEKNAVKLKLKGTHRTNAFKASPNVLSQTALTSGGTTGTEKSEKPTIKLKEAYEYRYDFGTRLTMTTLKVPAKILKYTGQDLKNATDLIIKIIKNDEISDKGLKAVEDKFDDIMERAPKAHEHMDRPVSVGGTFEIKGSTVSFEDMFNQTTHSQQRDQQGQNATTSTDQTHQQSGKLSPQVEQTTSTSQTSSSDHSEKLKSKTTTTLQKTIDAELKKGYQFKLTRFGAKTIKIECTQSEKSAKSSVRTLDQLQTQLEACLGEIQGKVNITQADDEDVLTLKGEESVINRVAQLLREATGKPLTTLSSKHSFFTWPTEEKDVSGKGVVVECCIQ